MENKEDTTKSTNSKESEVRDKKLTLELIANEISRLKGELAIDRQLNKDQSFISNLKYEISELENRYYKIDESLKTTKNFKKLSEEYVNFMDGNNRIEPVGG